MLYSRIGVRGGKTGMGDEGSVGVGEEPKFSSVAGEGFFSICSSLLDMEDITIVVSISSCTTYASNKPVCISVFNYWRIYRSESYGTDSGTDTLADK